MNSKVISNCVPQLCVLQNNNQTKKSTNLAFSNSLSFSTKSLPTSFHAKTTSGKLRITALASSTIGAFCIPTGSTETLYDLLGISKKGKSSEIKKAYKQLARKYHPDVSPPEHIEEHTRRFIMAKEAYDTLSDPQQRTIYDSNLANRSYPFAFSARNESQFDQKFDDIGEWANRWQSQVQEMERKSMNNRGKSSGGARMRRQR